MKNRLSVMIVGESGNGKTSAFGAMYDNREKKLLIKGLPPMKSLYLNVENQPLEYANKEDWLSIEVKSVEQVQLVRNALIAARNPSHPQNQQILVKFIQTFPALKKVKGLIKRLAGVEYVVLDSISKMTEHLEVYHTLNEKHGAKAYGKVKIAIYHILEVIKSFDTHMFVIALANNSELSKSCALVAGKAYSQGNVDKEFNIVLWAKPSKLPNGKIEGVNLVWQVNSENTAKAPYGMFREKLPNDAYELIKDWNEYGKFEVPTIDFSGI